MLATCMQRVAPVLAERVGSEETLALGVVEVDDDVRRAGRPADVAELIQGEVEIADRHAAADGRLHQQVRRSRPRPSGRSKIRGRPGRERRGAAGPRGSAPARKSESTPMRRVRRSARGTRASAAIRSALWNLPWRLTPRPPRASANGRRPSTDRSNARADRAIAPRVAAAAPRWGSSSARRLPGSTNTFSPAPGFESGRGDAVLRRGPPQPEKERQRGAQDRQMAKWSRADAPCGLSLRYLG